MKLIRIISASVAVLLFFTVCAAKAHASSYEYDTFSAQQLEASEADKLPDYLPDDTADLLDNLALTPENASSVSLSDIINSIFGIISNSSGQIITQFSILAFLIFFAAMLERLADSTGSSGFRRLIPVIVTSSICLTASLPVSEYISSSAVAIELCCSFDGVFIPIWSAINTAAGKAALSVKYSTLILAAVEGTVFLVNNTILPVLRIILAISLCSSLSPSLHLGGAVKLIEKNIKWILGFISILVAAVMGISTAAAGALDEITTKTVRFVLSSTVPVVGGAMGDALSSVTNSVLLLRTSVGSFGMIAMSFILMPALIKGALYTFGFNICALLADMFGIRCAKEISESCASVLSIMIALIIFTGVLTIFTLAVTVGR